MTVKSCCDVKQELESKYVDDRKTYTKGKEDYNKYNPELTFRSWHFGGFDMKCLYCGDELVEGSVALYEMATLIPKLHPATIKFKPDDSNKNVKKSNTYVKDSHGYYCERCKRIFADFAAE